VKDAPVYQRPGSQLSGTWRATKKSFNCGAPLSTIVTHELPSPSQYISQRFVIHFRPSNVIQINAALRHRFVLRDVISVADWRGGARRKDCTAQDIALTVSGGRSLTHVLEFALTFNL
jgi:hypothetical protein